MLIFKGKIATFVADVCVCKCFYLAPERDSYNEANPQTRSTDFAFIRDNIVNNSIACSLVK